MSSFKEFLRWFSDKDVLLTLEAMQKLIAFNHDKDIDMLKLGCTLPNLVNICLHNSTDAKLYPLTEGVKDQLQRIEKLLFLHAKQLMMNQKSESLLT